MIDEILVELHCFINEPGYRTTSQDFEIWLGDQLRTMRMPLHGEQMLDSHFRGVTEKGQYFLYCPVGRIVSWSSDDYENKWCHFEGKYVDIIK